MQTNNRTRYLRAWQTHIAQLAQLALAASTPETFDAERTTYERIRGELMAMLERAAGQQRFTHHNVNTVEVFLRSPEGELLSPACDAIVTSETVQEVEARFTRSMTDEGTLGEGEYVTAHIVRGTETEVPIDA